MVSRVERCGVSRDPQWMVANLGERQSLHVLRIVLWVQTRPLHMEEALCDVSVTSEAQIDACAWGPW